MPGIEYLGYRIYPDGRIWGKHRRLLKPALNGSGYPFVLLYDKGKRKTWLVHRLVATLFLPNPDKLPEVNHVDGNKENNHVSNLCWCSSSENHKHAYRKLGRKPTWPNGPPWYPTSPKKVESFDLKTGEILEVYDSTAEAGRSGFSQSQVSLCCTGKRKHHKGRGWRYAID